MSDTHLVESLRVDIDFDGLPLPIDDTDNLPSQLATFMRGPALQVIDNVFDQSIDADETWQIERLDLDLGPISIEPGQDWEDRCARALRERLQRLLADLREATARGTAPGEPPVRQRQARLQMLMFFLRHGHMPWYGRGRRADDPRELGRELLRDNPRELVAALRSASDQQCLRRRLAAQFDGSWLAELLHALLPDEPSTVARLLEVVLNAAHPGRSERKASAAKLWEAVLDHALSPGCAAGAPDIAVTRLQLQLALEADASAWGSHDPLASTTTAWRRLLHDDRAWLKQTLERLGHSSVLEQRLSRALPTDLLAELAGLWLAEKQTAEVSGWISAVVRHARSSTLPDPDRRQELWAVALGHLWAGGGDANFNRRRFARELRDRTGRTARLRGPRPPELARLDSLAEPDQLHQAAQDAVLEGDAGCERLAREWPDQMLLEAACLHQPQARSWVAAVIASPPHDHTTVHRRWAYTLRHLVDVGRAGRFDEAAYLQGLVHHVSKAAGSEPEDAARRWSTATRDSGATPAWIARVMAIDGPSAQGPADSSTSEKAHSHAKTPVTEAPEPALGNTPSPERTVAAQGLVHKVTQALTQLAGHIGRRLGRWLMPGAGSATTAHAAAANETPVVIHIDNAGLVLIGPYIVRLFESLGLVEGKDFIDDAARERGVHLLQMAVDGQHEAAAESRLVLNKLLCGWTPDVPIDRRFAATPLECQRIDGLLEAIVGHWRILGSSSVSTLRETFLQRPGQLQRRPDGAWALSVEPGPFDMLLDHLPWGYAMQKLPWMDEVLHVQWR